MIAPGQSKHITATGNVAGAESGGVFGGCSLTPAAAVATLVVREGGAAGNILVSLQAAANGKTVEWFPTGGVAFAGQLHATISGAGASAAIMV